MPLLLSNPMQIREEIPPVWDWRNFSCLISPTHPCFEEGRGHRFVAYFLTQRFHPDSANETKWFRDKRMHSSIFPPFTQPSWKENESRDFSFQRNEPPFSRFIDVLLLLFLLLLHLLFPVLIVLTRSSPRQCPLLSLERKTRRKMIEQRKEKKRREDGKMEIFEALVPPFIIRTFFLFIFPCVYIFLYVYFTHNVRITRVLIKKKKYYVDRNMRIIEDFIERVECFLEEWYRNCYDSSWKMGWAIKMMDGFSLHF